MFLKQCVHIDFGIFSDMAPAPSPKICDRTKRNEHFKMKSKSYKQHSLKLFISVCIQREIRRKPNVSRTGSANVHFGTCEPEAQKRLVCSLFIEEYTRKLAAETTAFLLGPPHHRCGGVRVFLAELAQRHAGIFFIAHPGQ